MNNGSVAVSAQCKVTRSCAVFAAVAVFVFVLVFSGQTAYAASLNVTQHTKTDIAKTLKDNAVTLNDPVTFSQTPTKPDVAGELSGESKESALKLFNAIRYIAGLDPVTLDETQGQNAQAAAFANWSINTLTHYPGSVSKPEGMPDDVWKSGVTGASNSNLAWGNASLNRAIIDGWMGDSDANNVEKVGHRSWCLNPSMSTTGFGATDGDSYTDRYYAMWSMDQRATGSQTNVSWPASITPVEFFDDNDAWSLHTGNTSWNSTSVVNVTLTRRASSPSGAGSWLFSSANSYTAASSGEFFSVQENNPLKGYNGQGGVYIIFRPADVTYKPGDIFDVAVTGLGSEQIDYTVEFMTGYPVESATLGSGVFYTSTSSWKNVLALETTPSDAADFEVAWTSSDESVCTVSDGVVSAVGVGTAVVTATIPGEYTSSGNPLSVTRTVCVPKGVSDCTFSIANPEYTGSVVRPAVRLVDPDNGYVLVEGTDYELEFPTDLVSPDDGDAIVWIQGKDAYSGGSSLGLRYWVVSKSDAGSAGDKAGSASDNGNAAGSGKSSAESGSSNGAGVGVGESDSVDPSSVKTVTVNVKNVTAKAIADAIAKAGGDAKYVTKIVLGSKVKTIKAKAFKGLVKVKTVQVKSTKIKKAKSVKNCFKGSKVTKVKVPKKKLSAYKRIFTKKNCGVKKLKVTK